MNKTYSMISLAFKAGKVITGEDAVRTAVKYGKVKLMIISEDASANTSKRFTNTAAYYDVPYIVWGKKEQLGQCIGKSDRAVVGITEAGFAENMKRLTNQVSGFVENAGGEPIEQNENI